MCDKTERLRQTPRWIRIGCEARMHHSKCRTHSWIGEIFKIITNLYASELTFINEFFARKRSHIKTNRIVCGDIGILMGNIISENEKLFFKVFFGIDIVRTFHENHFHNRFYAFRKITQVGIGNRNWAVS